MRIFKTGLSLCLAALLAACIDADVEMNFTDAETIEGRISLKMTRQLYDMVGQSPEDACPGGETELTAESFTCVANGSGTIDDLIAKQTLPLNMGEGSPADGARFERTGDNSLKVTMDFAEAFKDRQTPQDTSGMEDMLRPALAGHNFTFTIKAHKITSTTGTLSDDGKTASFIIPVVKLLDKEPDFGGPFVTEVQLEPSCFLWVFCD